MVGSTTPKHLGLVYLGKIVEQARRSKQINSWLRSVPKYEILNPKLVVSTTAFFLVCCAMYRINNRNFAIRIDYEFSYVSLVLVKSKIHDSFKDFLSLIENLSSKRDILHQELKFIYFKQHVL